MNINFAKLTRHSDHQPFVVRTNYVIVISDQVGRFRHHTFTEPFNLHVTNGPHVVQDCNHQGISYLMTNDCIITINVKIATQLASTEVFRRLQSSPNPLLVMQRPFPCKQRLIYVRSISDKTRQYISQVQIMAI